MFRAPIVLLHLAGTVSSSSTSMRLSRFFSVGMRRVHTTKSSAATFAFASASESASFDPSTLVDAGIGRVAFLRHGNTSPTPEGGTDFDRVLTALGEGQVRSAGSSFGASSLLLPLYSSVLCSPAPRCVATAGIFLDAAGLFGSDRVGDDKAKSRQARPRIETLPTLYDGTMQPEGSRLFRKHGYAPLRAYLEDEDGEDREAAAEVLGGYANDFLSALTNALTAGGRGGGGEVQSEGDGEGGTEETCCGADGAGGKSATTLLVVGHAVYLPSAALALASVCGTAEGGEGEEEGEGEDEDEDEDCGGIDLILDTNTREAEGYLVEVDTGGVCLLHRAQPTDEED